MSALRDCDDARRRTNLMNRIIQKAVEHSQSGSLNEEGWRLKVELKLPKK